MRQIQDGFLWLWFFIVVLTVACGLVNTLFMSIFERIRELGIIQALGLKPLQVQSLVLCESGVLIFFGLIIGNLLSYLTVFLLSGGIDISAFAKGAEMIGTSAMLYPKLLPMDLLVSNVLIIAVGLLSSFYPAWKATRFSPAEAIRKV